MAQIEFALTQVKEPGAHLTPQMLQVILKSKQLTKPTA